MNERLKIGLFIDNFYPAIDGVVIAVDNIAKELSKFNDVVVVAPYEGPNIDDSFRPYKVIRIMSLPVPFSEYRLVGNKSTLSSCYQKLVKENFDIIHIHSPFNIGKLGIKIASKNNIPCIGTVHTRFDFEIGRIINNKFIINNFMKSIMNVYNKCDKTIVVNDPLIAEIKKFGYNYEPIVIYNGTDLKPLKNKNLDVVDKLYDLKSTDNVLLFVGRIIDIKNIFFILEALKLLKEENINFKMLYIGTGPDEKELKEKIKNYQMQDLVLMPGKVTDRSLLSLIYARADLLLFPSLMDTSSLVRIEAAVNETPGLFIDGSMAGAMINNNVNGFTCELDEFKYKERIKEILKDKDLLNKVSKEARNSLGKSWYDVSKETYNLYLESRYLCEK